MYITDATYRRIIIAIICLVGIALYAHTLNFPFVFDSKKFIEFNPLVQDLDYFKQIVEIDEFTQLDERLGLHPDVVTSFMLRPVSYLTFSLNYMFDGLDPDGYRAINIAVHVMNAILLYLLVLRLLTKSPKCISLDRFSLRFIPTATALFFLVHPLQTESVIYVIQRFTSLATAFYLVTVYLYIRSVTGGDKRYANLLRIASLLAMLIGMLTKEMVFTAPFILILVETIVLENPLKTSLKRIYPHLFCLPLLPLLVMVVTAHQNNSDTLSVVSMSSVYSGGYSTMEYAITQLCVLTTYLRLLLFPYGQNIDHDYPLYTSLLQGKVMLSLIVLVALLVLIFERYRRNRADMRSSMQFFGIAWFFVVISVTSSIVPLSDLMTEHTTYMPSIGIFLVFACMIDRMRTRWRSKVVLAGMLVWGLALCGLTYARSEVWRSRISIWQDSVAKSPAKERPLYALGMAYFAASRFEEAASCFQKILARDRNAVSGYAGLGAAFIELKQFEKAVEVSKYGILLAPNDPNMHHHLGIAYANLGLLHEAEQSFLEAVNINPASEIYRMSLAKTYVTMKRYEAALQQYRIAAQRITPDRELRQTIRQLESLLSSESR